MICSLSFSPSASPSESRIYLIVVALPYGLVSDWSKDNYTLARLLYNGKVNDVKTYSYLQVQRRLAQNREAARKSRLRKKVEGKGKAFPYKPILMDFTI